MRLANCIWAWAAVLQRNRLGDLRYDPSRNALSAIPNKTVTIVPKFYVEWDDDNWAAIAGTYRIGFGQRLTFDSTSEITPNGFRGDDQIRRENDLQRRCRDSTGELEGSPCAGAAGGVRVTPDYKWTNRLTGVALGLKKLKLKSGHLQAYAWGSYQVNSIYQYELYDRNRCDDPRDDNNDEDCKAPPLFRRADPLVDTSTLSYQTLLRMYAEMLAGGNFTYHIDERIHVGVTGYGANVRWLVDGLDLDFQEYAATPFGGPYGAIGVDAAVGFGIQDFFMEVSRSFDSQADDGNGGFGAILRSVTGLANTELEVSARYYDKKFNNPYGRPISAADEFDGRRARDEIGLRVQSESDFGKKVSLRTRADIWHASADDVLQLELFVRTDIDWTKKFATAIWATYRNKNLGNGGRGQCYDESNQETDTGEAIPCFGQLIRTAARAQYKPLKKLKLSLQYQHVWRDDKDYADRFRQDIAAIFGMSVRPIDRLNIRARVRYDWDDIADNGREEHTLWSYLDVGVKVREKNWIRARYDLRFWLDERASTALREPSREHWLWLVYEAKF